MGTKEENTFEEELNETQEGEERNSEAIPIIPQHNIPATSTPIPTLSFYQLENIRFQENLKTLYEGTFWNFENRGMKFIELFDYKKNILKQQEKNQFEENVEENVEKNVEKNEKGNHLLGAISVRNALQSGYVNDTWSSFEEVLELKFTSNWAKLLSKAFEDSSLSTSSSSSSNSKSRQSPSNFSFIEIGCFNKEKLVAAKVAHQNPSASVLAIHVCGSEKGDLGALVRVAEEANLLNLAISSPSTLDVAELNSLRDMQLQEELRCDHLALTNLEVLSKGLLPNEFESLLAKAFTLCGSCHLSTTLPNKRFFSYWSNTEALIGACKKRMFDYDVHLLPSSSSSSSSSSKSSSSSSSSSIKLTTYGSASHTSSSSSSSLSLKTKTSSGAKTLHQVSVKQKGTNSTDLFGIPAFTFKFLIQTGLLGQQRIELFQRLLTFFDCQEAYTEDVALYGRQIEASNKIKLMKIQSMKLLESQMNTSVTNIHPPPPLLPIMAPNTTRTITSSSHGLSAPLPLTHTSSSFTVLKSRRRNLLSLLFENHPSSVLPGQSTNQEPSSSSSPKLSSSTRLDSEFDASEDSSAQDGMLMAEEAQLDWVWQALKTEIGDDENIKNMAIIGSELGMFSVKVSLSYPDRTILSIRQSLSHIKAHLKLLDLLLIKNNIPCISNLNFAVIQALLEIENDKFNIGILGSSIFTLAIKNALHFNKDYDDHHQNIKNNVDVEDHDDECDWLRFEQYLGGMFSLSSTSYFILPKYETIIATMNVLAPQCVASFNNRYRMNMENTDLFSSSSSSSSSSFSGFPGPLHVLSSSPEECLLVRAVAAAGGSGGSLHIRRLKVPSSSDAILVRIQWTPSSTSTSLSGVSLYSLLHLGVVPTAKAELLRAYLELPLWRYASLPALVPWKMRFYTGHDGGDDDEEEGSRRRSSRLSFLVDQDAHNYSGAFGHELAASSGDGGINAEDGTRAAAWRTLSPLFAKTPAEHQNGRFSFIEFGSGTGVISRAIATEYPNATILSIEDNEQSTEFHLKKIMENKLWNNILCIGDVNSMILQKFYESPEMFRYQIYGPSLLELIQNSKKSNFISHMMSTGLTTFIHLPSEDHIRLAMNTFYPYKNDYFNHDNDHDLKVLLKGPIYQPNTNEANEIYGLYHYNKKKMINSEIFHNIDIQLLQLLSSQNDLSNPLRTSLKLSRIQPPMGVAGLSLIRCDIIEMKRNVHHHYDYAKDGHKRTYTMNVFANQTTTSTALTTLQLHDLTSNIQFSELKTNVADVGIRWLKTHSGNHYELPLGHHLNNGILTSVVMIRDQSTHIIPYNSIKAVTLIAVLRLGLVNELKQRAYKLFVKLPLYEDMAPWNIVFDGQSLDYIDYDTKEKTFDEEVKRTYQVLSVLMNYKRTVSDFSKCGTKTGNPYNFPFLSECVKSSSFSGPCEDPEFPVACGDGQCRSDYITCLRSIVEGEEETASQDKENENEDTRGVGREFPSIWKLDEVI